MSVALKVELSPGAEAIVASLQTLPGRIVQAVAGAMDEANQYAITTIQRDHLTGAKGRRESYPPEDHRLVTRTNRLRGSVYASPSQEVSAGNVQSVIGSNVIYAAIHEYGGEIQHPARQRKIRHRLDSGGNLLKQAVNSRLLVFAKKGHKRVREQVVETKAYTITMPERAPFRTGLDESRPKYKQLISRAILAEWQNMQSGQ